MAQDNQLPTTAPYEPLFQLSQGHLQTLDRCPRKFQYLYLEQLGAPLSPDEQLRLQWGSQFHLLLQQRELGLTVEALAMEHSPLDTWLANFLEAEPNLIAPDLAPLSSPVERYSEHLRSQMVNDFLMVAIYDLLLLAPEWAQVLDWKTYAKPQQPERLIQSWQTRLYLYLLAETSPYEPEQLAMTYWFFQTTGESLAADPASACLRIPYSTTLHRRTQRELTQWLDRLKHFLSDYAEGKAFPQVDISTGVCATCPFVVQCQRSTDPQQVDLLSQLPGDLAEIPEVAL